MTRRGRPLHRPDRLADGAAERERAREREGARAVERCAPANGPMEMTISRILQAGVLTAAVTILFGSALWAAAGDSGYPAGFYPVAPEEVVAGAIALRPLAVIQVGLVFLVLTPVLRVAASVLLFWRERDWSYVAITMTVLALLLTSLLTGVVG